MIRILAIGLLAAATNLPQGRNTQAANSRIARPVFAEPSNNPNGLTLYNEKGEIVARCAKKDGMFQDCKTEPGVSLDDLMNAWVHAYLDVQK